MYRNLKLMELDGEIGHLEMPDGPDRYDANPLSLIHILIVGRLKLVAKNSIIEIRSFPEA